jgi:nucleoside-diphosphate-sugar epimerase
MRLLVTGGNGWIGGEYIKHNKYRHEKITSYDLPDNDILDLAKMSEAIREHDVVIHFAAIADLYQSMGNQNKNFDVNIKGVYQIGRLCAEMDKTLVFISTCCVYGNSLTTLETEDQTIPACDEPYATSKMAGEYILRGVPGLKYIILRIGTAYGPGQRSALFTQVVVDKMKAGETIQIHGKGHQSRQLIYIDDLVLGITAAVDHLPELANREILNICGNEHISALSTMETAAKILKINPNWIHVEDRYGQTYYENCSIAKAKRLLDWQPHTKFIDGMKQTING